MKFITTKYSNFIKENWTKISTDDEKMLEEANKKIRRAIIWLNINKGFYANLLPYLNIYGSFYLNPKTMATDGKSIVFHPEFVLDNNDARIRFVICHEILHCVLGHHDRLQTKNPLIWNYATDYAINPILMGEEGLEFPEYGLYKEKYAGMVAEDIYDILIKDMKDQLKDEKNKPLDEIKKTEDMPTPHSDNVVQTGEGEDDDDNGEEDNKTRNKDDKGGKGDQDGSNQNRGNKDDKGGKGDKGDQDGSNQNGSESDGEEGKEESDDKDGGEEKNKSKRNLPKVGEKVKLLNGREAVIKKVYDNGDIEI